jgi:TldD protein
MNALSPSPSILETHDVDPKRALDVLQTALHGADDGELFLERAESEGLMFDDGRLKQASYDSTEGFGLRVVSDETAGYAHSSEISEAAIRRAADASSLAKRGHDATVAEGPRQTNAKLYGEDDPLAHPVFGDKISLLQEIDAFARARDPRVVQVTASIFGERRHIEILRAGRRARR